MAGVDFRGYVTQTLQSLRARPIQRPTHATARTHDTAHAPPNTRTQLALDTRLSPTSPQAAATLCEAQTLAIDRLGGQAPKLPEQVRVGGMEMGPSIGAIDPAGQRLSASRSSLSPDCRHSTSTTRPTINTDHTPLHPQTPTPPKITKGYAYAQGMYTLVADAAKTRRPAGAAAFRAALSTAAARAAGARYKPEVAAAVAALPRKTSDGLPVEMGVDLDKDLKVGGGGVEWGGGQGIAA
jgi:hypothetical protein